MDPISAFSDFQLEHLRGVYDSVDDMVFFEIHSLIIDAVKYCQAEMHEVSLYQYLMYIISMCLSFLPFL